MSVTAGTPSPATRPDATTPTDHQRPARAAGSAVAELGDTLRVEIANVATLAAQLDCRVRAGDRTAFALYLGGRPLAAVAPNPPTDLAAGTLAFPLQRNGDNQELWSQLLGRPGFAPRAIEVSVGLADRFALPSTATIALRPLPPWPFAFWLLLFAVLLASFSKLARHSELLRDPGPVPADGARRPYSLARLQAAWWFFLVLACYLFIGVVTGDFNDSLTGTVLVLLGISAGTTMGSAAVDAGKEREGDATVRQAAAAAAAARLADVEAEAAAAKLARDAAPTDAGARSDYAAKLAARSRLESQLATLGNRSQGFLLDILTDADGVCFHRFQSAAWNLVLGFVFLFAVWRDLAMPQFSETLLGLMGISAGTYLGLKLPEATVPQQSPPV